MPWPDSRWAFTALVALVAAERLVELVVSRRHERWLRARGGVELGAGHYPWMVALHSTFLAAAPAEVWLLERPFLPALAVPCAILVAGSMALRYWAVATLGRRWTTRVLCLPGQPVVTRGPYRFLRHPNYAAVVVELVALPLLHAAWVTALVFGLANLALLRVRIAVEDRGLAELCGGGRWAGEAR